MQVITIETLDGSGSNTKLYLEPKAKQVIAGNNLEVMATVGDCHIDKDERAVAIRRGYGLVIIAVTGSDVCQVHVPNMDFKYATVSMGNSTVFQSDQREPWVVLEVRDVGHYLIWVIDHDISVESISAKTAQLLLGSHRSN